MKELIDLGFEKNTKVINGYKPQFKKGNDILFIIGTDFWPSKVYSIGTAFENYPGKVYGVKTDKAPRVSDLDWITAKLTLLKLSPLSKGRWRADGEDIEFISTVV